MPATFFPYETDITRYKNVIEAKAYTLPDINDVL